MDNDIIWQGMQHSVRRELWGYGVYCEGATHATLVGRYGLSQGEAGRAIHDAERRDGELDFGPLIRVPMVTR